ncbi:zinc ribbon domain-containing protein [Candidatus Calescamantes bacterium]|nr:zinc ribbon domain-containing protein [Candidatus Calescamantes bacterium]
MPIYTFKCKKCGNEFELLVGISSNKMGQKCPKCGSKEIERLLSSFSVGKPNSSSTSCPTGTCPLTR